MANLSKDQVKKLHKILSPNNVLKLEVDELQTFRDLAKLDCLDNSCHFKGKGDEIKMRTNGGCRCLDGVPIELKRKLVSFYKSLEDYK